MNILFAQFKLFCSALAFLSWLPIPVKWTSSHELHKMGMYFPLAGFVLGGITSIVFWITTHFFPVQVSVAVTLLFYGLITGMFHDDALADVADGMGGKDQQSILSIMRDSRLGTYGVYALIATYLLRYAAWISIHPLQLMLNIAVYAAMSRLSGVFFLSLINPQDVLPNSLSQFVLPRSIWISILINAVWIGLLFYFLQPTHAIFFPVPVIGIIYFMRKYFLKRMGMINGDCAGSVIHITETVLHVCASVKI